MPNSPQKNTKRQIDLGVDLDGFDPTPRSPADNNIDLSAGYFQNPSDKEIYMKAAQIAGPFASVSGINRVRWDLVYLDDVGVAQVEAGAEQITPVADYTGAPGNGSPTTADDVWPVAYVKVDESGGVVVDITDITALRGYMRNREIGVVGELATDNNAGAVGVLGTNFNVVPIDHQHPPNVDGVNPSDTEFATTSPGASNVYSRRDHVHQCSTALQNTISTPYAKSQTCLWTPYDNSGAGNPDILKWVLHKFQARAANLVTFWFDINIGNPEVLELWPVDNGGTGNNIGPGFADDTDAVRAVVLHDWLYVYAVANPTTFAQTLVYSTNPPSVGPGLTNALFVAGGYTVWRWVTCLEICLDSTGSYGIPVPMSKIGTIVYKEQSTGKQVGGHVQSLQWAVTTLGNISMAEHVSPMARNVFVNAGWHLEDDGGGSGVTWLLSLPAGTVMGRQDRIRFATVTGEAKHFQDIGPVIGWRENYDGWWMTTDENRLIYIDLVLNSAFDYAWLWVVAYAEHDIEENTNINWSP